MLGLAAGLVANFPKFSLLYCVANESCFLEGGVILNTVSNGMFAELLLYLKLDPDINQDICISNHNKVGPIIVKF